MPYKDKEKRSKAVLKLLKIQQQKLRELKQSIPCNRCKTLFPFYVTDFHHREPENKNFRISNAMSRTMSWERIIEEIDKCDLLCANCHREIEYGHLLEKYGLLA